MRENELVSSLVSGLILDVACGTGRLFPSFEGKRFVGIDISLGMLKVASKFSNGNLIVCDSFFLPFKDDCFDTVLALRFIYYYETLPELVSEMKRVTRFHGQIIFNTVNKFTFTHLITSCFLRKRISFNLGDVAKTISSKIGNQFNLPSFVYRLVPRQFFFLVDLFEKIPFRKTLTYWRVLC